MSWIETIPYQDSTGRLRKLYDRVKGPDNNVDNIMMAHSLRPHTMEGHMAIYKHVLHHTGNTLPKAFLELIGVWVSLLNQCLYCVEHHYAGFVRLLDDTHRATNMRAALEAGDITSPVFDARRFFRWRDFRAEPSCRLFCLCQPHSARPWCIDTRRCVGIVAWKL